MIIRKAENADLDEIINIFSDAIKVMNENNIPQWDGIYPNAEILKDDIDRKQMYVAVKQDSIVACGVINCEYDEAYNSGKWVYTGDKFAIIHRLCVNPNYQNQKVARNTMILIEEMLMKQGTESVRLDTFSLNKYAIKLYDGLGYKRVGQANWRKGLFYLLEKVLI